MRKLTFICLILFISLNLLCAHYVPNTYHVIIDTDCSPDDLRSITMFMAMYHIEIEAFISTEGSLNPTQGCEKLNSLNTWFQFHIPVGTGVELNKPAPEWRDMNLALKWGKAENKEFIKRPAVEVLNEVFNEHDHIIYVELGPLTNLSVFLKKYPEQIKKIERILWYCSGEKKLNGFNYNYDPASADYVLSQKTKVDIVSLKSDISFNTELLSAVRSLNNSFSELISTAFDNSLIKEKLNNNHFKIWDDLVAVYFLFPELFNIEPDINNPNIRYCTETNNTTIINAINDIYAQTYPYVESIVFNEFPEDPKLFRYDIQIYVDSIIQKYGEVEWKACAITNEFHGHLGIYSLVGAKMGIKAREILNVPVDRIEVISFAGSTPPISCFTDGLQVSTGATLGQGTIRISDEEIKRPEAIFIFNSDTIRMKLKQEYLDLIKKDISYGIVTYGLQSDGYWKMVRQLAIKYWYEFDRNEIFEIEYRNR